MNPGERARLVALPDNLPLFPLSGALLLPLGRMPLNVFEPRYMSLVEDALGRHRALGMVQPVELVSGPADDRAEIYSVGCAGRITSFTETDDGRYVITITGVGRFRIREEALTERGYRQAAVDYGDFRDDLEEGNGRIADRQRLLDAVRVYFELKDLDADWPTIDEAPDVAVVNSLAMCCPFEPGEKQALLESADLGQRGLLLTTLMEMAVRQAGGTTLAMMH